MGTLIPILALLFVVLFGLLVTRIATVALTLTGLSRELARFQARSAFIGVGFTTTESEHVVDHPVRRRIVMILMLLGNAGFVLALSSLIPVFISPGGAGVSFLSRVLILASGMAALWAIAVSSWVDRQMFRITQWALKKWTHLDVRDYQSLLQLTNGYAVSEIKINPEDWLAGKALGEVRLGDEGVQVLGIRRADGTYLGAPTGKTFFRRGDTVVIYGLVEHIAELDSRRAGIDGDRRHEERVEEMTIITQQLENADRRGPRDEENGS